METMIGFAYAILTLTGLVLLVQWANKERPVNNKEDKMEDLQNGDIVVKLFDDNLYYKCTVRKSFGVTFYDRIEYPSYCYQEGGSKGDCSTYYYFVTGIDTTTPIGFASIEDCKSYKSDCITKEYMGYKYKSLRGYWFVYDDYYKADFCGTAKRAANGSKVFNKHYSEKECIDWIEQDVANKIEKEQRSKVIKL